MTRSLCPRAWCEESLWDPDVKSVKPDSQQFRSGQTLGVTFAPRAQTRLASAFTECFRVFRQGNCLKRLQVSSNAARVIIVCASLLRDPLTVAKTSQSFQVSHWMNGVSKRE